jgi:putative ABC transport system permease protein
MTALRLAFLHLYRKKLTTTIAILSLAISIAAGGVLIKLYWLSHSRFSSLALQGDAIFGAKAGGLDILLGALNLEGPYPEFLPLNLYESLKKRQTVAFADKDQSTPDYIRALIPLLYFAKYKNYRVIATDESFLNCPNEQDSPTIKQGRWTSSLAEVVIGDEIAKRERIHVGDSIALVAWTGDDPNRSAKQYSSTAKVAGIFAKTGTIFDAAVFSSLEEGRQVMAESGFSHPIWKTNVLNYCLVYLKPGTLPQLTNLINQRTVAQVVSVPEQYDRLKQLAETGQTMGLIIISLILLLGGMGVISTMISRFEAMSLQVAVLRAIGYTGAFIGRWLLWEGLLLGITACFVGAAIDMILFPTIRELLGNALPQSPLTHMAFYQSAPVWAIAILGIVLGVFIPIIRFNHIDAHSLLKGL